MSKHSVEHRPVCVSARTLNWPGFPSAFDTSTAAYHPEPTSLRNRFLRLNRSIILATQTCGVKSKLNRLSKDFTPRASGKATSGERFRRIAPNIPKQARKFTRRRAKQSWKNSSLTSNTILAIPKYGKPLMTCQVFPLHQRTPSSQRLNLHYEADRILQVSNGGRGLLSTFPTTCN